MYRHLALFAPAALFARAALFTLALMAASPAPAETSKRPVVVELFTSEGCSSCPPADAVLRDLARDRPDVLALGFHVTYWDYLGWHDPFALPEATKRQRDYGASLRGTVYTPQIVIDGAHDVVGSDRPAVLGAIRQMAASAVAGVAVRVRREGNSVMVDLGAGAGAGAVMLIGYDGEHRTSVARGENGGRSLVEANVVRSVSPLGAWSGEAVRFSHAVPAGERIAVLVQSAGGAIIGAAREDGHAS